MNKNVRISDISARPILDSRDEWTIETEVHLSDGSVGVASVPSGKSRGSREAFVVDTIEAIHNVEVKIKKAVKGVSVSDQKKFDELLCHLDGTNNKRHLGGNTILSVSIAALKAFSISAHEPLHKTISLIARNNDNLRPRLFVNVINGGAHAGNNLQFQEYIIIPKEINYKEAIAKVQKVYSHLREVIERRKGRGGALNIGDEGGFAPNCLNELEPFEIIKEAIDELGLSRDFDFGLDSAAGNHAINGEKMKEYYREMKTKFPLIYLEDPFSENAWQDFAEINKEFSGEVIIAGDDLTTTNTKYVKQAINEGAISGVIIKPNQIGTVSEAIEAAQEARANSIKVIVSHRSGETNDDFIADFAYGVGAFGFKLGSPARGERVAKYNRLMQIEESL